MLDPSCPDITGRVIEALCRYGLTEPIAAIRTGRPISVRYAGADGSWYGRWGVDYLYGTFLALRGLHAAGVSDREAPFNVRSNGSRRSRMRMAAGARAVPAMITTPSRLAQHGLPNGMGRSRPARGR